MSQTIVEKLAQAHGAGGPGRHWRAGDFVSIRPHRVMTHDNTAAVMKKFRAIGAQRMNDMRQVVFALDHDIQNRSEENLKKYREIEALPANTLWISTLRAPVLDIRSWCRKAM